MSGVSGCKAKILSRKSVPWSELWWSAVIVKAFLESATVNPFALLGCSGMRDEQASRVQ
jgi:hypothetical protein